jgi:pSer/pThr/pTyr-binding forkhead associated (FHA) protein
MTIVNVEVYTRVTQSNTKGVFMDRIPVLVAVEGPLTGQRFPLKEGDDNTIGRAEECSITVPDPDISRRHASVILHNAAVWVQDDHSRNGVLVNDKRVVRRPQELRPGGKIILCAINKKHVFELELEDPSDDTSLVLPIQKQEETKTNYMWVVMVILILVAIAVAVL